MELRLIIKGTRTGLTYKLAAEVRKVFLKSRIISWGSSNLIHSHDAHSFLYSFNFIMSVPDVITGRFLPVTFKIVEFSLRSSRNGRAYKGVGAN